MIALRRAAAMAGIVLAATLAAAPALAADLVGGGRAYFVGPECRVRAEGPIDCDEVTRVRHLVGEAVAVQLVVEAGPAPVHLLLEDDGAAIAAQGWVEVTRRSRGAHPDEALPWAAAARPDDATILGRVAEPFFPLGVRDGEPTRVQVDPGQRRAFWLRMEGGVSTTSAPVVEPAGGPRLAVETIDTWLPRPVVSFFAYLERDELTRHPVDASPAGADRAARELADLLERHGVLPVDRATDVDELGLQLEGAGSPSLLREVERDLVVLGAYGTLGEPTDAAVGRVVSMAEKVPDAVRDVVLYAVDEDCASDLGPRWRAALRERGGAASRVKVLVTCSGDPRALDVDVVMTTAERFRPAVAAAARAAGQEIWVYNGRLPQAGPMALDAPPESLIWSGWIAARYDVRRWFLWNVDHWSDSNRGGHGPRDPFTDPETFHNADGDAVLYDGLLVFPASRLPRDIAHVARGGAVLAGARLARLHRGIQDAGLLALAASVDPTAARAAIDRVIPRALGDVADDERPPFGNGRAIAESRALLHEAIATARAEGRLPSARATRRPPSASGQPGLAALRADLALRSKLVAWSGGGVRRSSRLAALLAVGATCLALASIAAWRLGRRRRRGRSGAPPSPGVG